MTQTHNQLTATLTYLFIPKMSRGNKVTIFAFAMMLCILLQNMSNAATFPAGGANGWGFGLNGWPNGQTFKAGDVIGENS